MEKENLNTVEGYQLSINQMNLWSVASKNLEKYYNQVVIDLEDRLLIDKLRRVLTLVVRKNETLLFKMSTVPGATFPVQSVSEGQQVNVYEETVSSLDTTTINAATASYLSSDYNPMTSAALRVCLLTDTNGNQVLVIRLFSLWADTYSTTYVCNELYKAIQDEGAYENEEKEVVEYQDFAAWQQQLFNDPEEEGVNFWKNYTVDISKEILPFKEVQEGQFTPQRQPICVIEGDKYQELKNIASQNNYSLESHILSKYVAYLSQFEKDQCTLGYIPYKRYYAELEHTFGLVAKSLPVHLEDLEQLLGEDVEKSLQKSIDEIGMWSDYFYLNRMDNTTAPIFKYCFEYIDVNENTNSQNNFKIQDIYSVTDAFEIKVNAVNYGDRLVLELYYDSNVFTQKAIDVIISQLQSCFASQAISTVGKEIITVSNNTAKENDTYNSIVEVFENQVQLDKDKIALFSNEMTLTYEELSEKSDQFAQYLIKEYHLQKGDPVAILLDRSEYFMISVLGVLKAGGYYIPIDTSYPKERIQFILDDCQSAILISNEKSTNPLTFSIARTLDPTKECIYTSSTVIQEFPEVVSNDTAYSIYTSGSTGNPKGCLINHGNLLNYILWANDYYFETSHIGNWGLVTSVSFDLTVTALFTSITRGKKLWIGSEEKEIDELLIETFSHSEVDTLKLTPSHLSLLKELPIAKTNIKVIICGGEQLTQNQLQGVWAIDPAIRVFNEYGPTEATVGCIVKEMSKKQPEVCIGKPIANTVIDIVDSEGVICDVGVSGEIVITGAGVSKGYLNRTTLTHERFIKNKNQYISYKTGDIGRWSIHGEVIYEGRKDDQVKIRGYRIELGEVEKQLTNLKTIDQAVVLIDDKNEEEKTMIAYVVSSQKENVEDLKTYLKDKLPEYMVPASIVEVDTIPLTTNGKVDKNFLLELNTGNIPSRAVYVAPKNDTEKQIIAIWEEILQIDKIGTQDDFFELGGHSLKATQLINQYHKIFDVKLGLKEIFSNTTVATHASLIDTSEISKHAPIARVEDKKDYPVSDGQRRLWVLSQFTNGTEVYNMPSSVSLKGTYNAECFSKAMNAAIDRHEILRTVFRVNDDGEVRQVVKTTEELNFSVEYVDYRSVFHKEELAKSYIRENAYVPFDLENGPLLRVSLLQLSDEDYMFYYNMHHIICDGWSMNVLAKDVLAFYEYYLEGKKLEVPTLKIQYRDYATWQQKEVQQEKNNGHKEYWLKALSGELPTLDLPIQNTRPAVKTYAGNSLKTYIPSNITSSLKAFGQREGGSLFIGLLATWNILFQKYTSENDIIIGTPVAGRDHADLNDQIGFYVNTLPLRNQILPEESFASFYNRVKENTLLSYEHQMYPFDRLVDDLDIRNDTSRSAVFDVMLMLQNIREIKENTSLNADAFQKIEDKGFKVSKFDMDIAFKEEGDYMAFSITYNTDIYSQEAVRTIMQHYKQLLDVVLQNPDQKIKEIDYISEAEKQKLIVDFNANTTIYPKDKTLMDLFNSQVVQTPDNMALLFKETSYTYEELDKLSNQFAHCLRDDYQVSKGDFIGVQLDRSDSVIIAILGIMKAGAVYIPIDIEHPASRKSYIYEDTKICLLIGNPSSVSAQANFEGIVLDIEKDFEPATYQDTVVNICLSPDDLAYIIYTSGSTGNPKGVIIEHKGILNTILAQIELFGITHYDRGLQFASFSFDASISEIFTALLSGACLCVIDKEHREDPKLLETYIINEKIDVATIPPSYLSLMNVKSLSRLKTLITAGESPVYTKVEEYLKLGNYYNAYGPTETSICSSMYGLRKGENLPKGNIPIGVPIANTQTFILDQNDKIVPVGVVGEICIGGAGLAKGYLNRPDLTKEKFMNHPYKKGERLYKTGDIGRWLPDGNIEFIGRKDDQVKINGYRIELGEVEQSLVSHELINEAVVMTDVNQYNIKSLIAYIVTKEEVSLEQLRTFLKGIIPHYSIPSEFISLKQLPITINGKIDKKALTYTSGSKVASEKVYIAPQTEKEKIIIQIIATQLGKDPNSISILDNFFDLGANSIKIVKILNEINKQLETEVKVVSLFENPNVNEFIQYLEMLESQEQNEIEEPEDISEALDEFINLM
ncbi:non-ribosomal peptide synthetase [uncultured Dokdonia sp.]|uniref:non-ribosomal peptide synthetase n=1 Tax=uncultured Dokdonia sp. TaxID=575653 RepID=UPI00262A7A30|nr:non-ribosomal peptide synthetase [uncultured Dokdonia sp.]